MLKNLDRLGISASLLCALHCSILPLGIAGGLFSSSVLMGHGFIEIFFIFLSVGIAALTLLKSYRDHHRNFLPMTLFFFGIISIAIGLNFHGLLEIILATFGGITVASAHFINLRLNKNQVAEVTSG